MIYLLTFFIIYLLIFSNVCKTTEDFNDSVIDYDRTDERNSELSVRQINTQLKIIPANFIGSNLFGCGISTKQCFSVEDVALIATRSRFEALIPNVSSSTQNLEDDKSVEVMLEYFYRFNELLNKMEKNDLKLLSQQAFYDVVGGYLNYLYWPLVKHSFYAGMLTYNSTIRVYTLHKHCKEALNTIGNGWRQSKDFSQLNSKIEPINPSANVNHRTDMLMSPVGRDSPCETLLLGSDDENPYRFQTDLIVSLPEIEADDSDGILNIRLPFKRKQNFNFNSKASAFVLLKYYVTVSKCYVFRKQSSERFDMRFQKVVKEKFLPFVRRENFYPGLGAILRIIQSLHNRGVVSRNIEDDAADSLNQLIGNMTTDDTSGEIVYDTQRNRTTFIEEVVHFIHLEKTNGSRKIEVLFFLLVGIVIALTLLLCCCCIIMRKKRKNGENNSREHPKVEKHRSFKSFFQRFRACKKDVEKKYASESNIGPRSSSILVGNDFDDTESRVSTQTKFSGLSLKDLIHTEISKRPNRPSKEQIKALSRNSKSKK